MVEKLASMLFLTLEQRLQKIEMLRGVMSRERDQEGKNLLHAFLIGLLSNETLTLIEGDAN